ncbi:extensin family protein [Methylobacterium sp. J-076]|uniref:extensin family protein n=1 Tax=Methylobacterium sp. J-076 TaxID=2836655 RepID=UPI001FB97A82|nr:extensin family protein [Methylobacterium sp. J-076]MCJ2013955.1 extensin family protein [Methylobacterium sp. J-076]
MSRVVAWSAGCGVVLLLGAAAAAQAIPPDTAPKPPERPAGLVPAPPIADAPAPPERPAELTPAPAPKPDAGAAIPVPPPVPPERPADLSGEAALALTVAPPDDEACRTRLKRLGAAFEPLPPIAEGQCTAPLPLKVTALADSIALRPAATLTCRSAEELARWATEVQVEAQRALGKPLAALDLGGTYVCRGQNHDVDAKLSEHAFADAIDVMGFTFAGRPPIVVREAPGEAAEVAFLKAVRGKACAYFRTVLGPGSNAAHANHFHLDERERQAGHRLCE